MSSVSYTPVNKIQYKNSVLQKQKQFEENIKSVKPSYLNATYRKKEEIKNSDILTIEEEPKLICAILVKSRVKCPPKARKIMDILGLKRMHNLKLFSNNKSIKQNLFLIKEYISYGYVEFDTLKELVALRGFFKGRKSLIPVNFAEQQVVEETFLPEIFNGNSTVIKKLDAFKMPPKNNGKKIRGEFGKYFDEYVRGFIY